MHVIYSPFYLELHFVTFNILFLNRIRKYNTCQVLMLFVPVTFSELQSFSDGLWDVEHMFWSHAADDVDGK